MNERLYQRLKIRKGKIIYLLFTEAVLLFLLLNYLLLKNTDNAIIVTVTMFLAMIPIGMELVFHMLIPWPVYGFAVLYTLGHTIGYCFGLYLYFPWWDNMMHCVEGFLFTMFGYYYLSEGNKFESEFSNSIGGAYTNSDKVDCRRTRGNDIEIRIRNIIFGISLSILIAVLWEIAEYMADKIWLLDMQKDVFISRIDSYLLAGNTGNLKSIENISDVVVGGQILPGYIDIGLIDTMDDLIMALLGSLLFSVYGIFDGDRHPVLKFEKR